MPDSDSNLIARYQQVRRRLAELERERETLDAELIELERKLPEGFESDEG